MEVDIVVPAEEKLWTGELLRALLDMCSGAGPSDETG